jgi:excisionase family DNA binding protein
MYYRDNDILQLLKGVLIMLLRTKEAADRIGVKTASLRQLEKRGLIHCVRDWAGHRRFEESDVEEFQKKLRSGFENPAWWVMKRKKPSNRQALGFCTSRHFALGRGE